MKTVNFGNKNWKDALLQCYSFRFTETPDFTELDGCISTAVNKSHREGFDNISLIAPEKYGAGTKVSLRCSFEGTGCPEIILVEKPERCDDGVLRYGACFEIVLYRNGINVWRHFYGKAQGCSWHKRLGYEFPLAENVVYELEVTFLKGYIVFKINGTKVRLRTDDMPCDFFVGTTACEGIVRLYELKISSGDPEK